MKVAKLKDDLRKANISSKRKHETCPNCNKKGIIINRGNFTIRRICYYCKWEKSEEIQRK